MERVLTDNGSCFKRRWADACNDHEIAVKKTRPYRPQTNGKAERFIRTLLERWAYAYTYANEIRTTRSSRSRTRLLQSLPSPPRPQRTHTAPTRQQRPWDKQLAHDVVLDRPQRGGRPRRDADLRVDVLDVVVGGLR